MASDRNDPRVLIEELLHNVNASGNRILERRLADLSVWFYQNWSQMPKENVIGKLAMLEKTCWTLLEITALLAERVHELEEAKLGKSLWVPKGMSVDGDLRELE